MYKFFFPFCCLLFLLASCSPFSKYAKHTEEGHEGFYKVVYNKKVNFKSLTFGDVHFATNMKDFKRLSDDKPEFKSILLYAQADEPDYEYYVLLNPRKKDVDEYRFNSKEITIEKNQFLFIISADAPESDTKFIEQNIKNLED